MPFRLFLEELRFFYLEYTESSGGQHIAYFVFVASARSSVFLLSRPRIEMIIFASGLVELVAVTICIKCLLIIFQLVEIPYRAILLTMKSECLSNVYLYLFHNRFLLLATCTSGLTSKTDLAYKNKYNNRETEIRTRKINSHPPAAPRISPPDCQRRSYMSDTLHQQMTCRNTCNVRNP